MIRSLPQVLACVVRSALVIHQHLVYRRPFRIE